jgi:hypothetical protein
MKKFLGLMGMVIFCAFLLRGQQTKVNVQTQTNSNPTTLSRKPATSDAIRYVSANGNDSNDGLSIGSAKLTMYAALEALPGGATSPPTSGCGEVDVSGSVNYGGPLRGGGLYLFGRGDPNYAAGSSGWLRFTGSCGANGSSLKIRCIAPNGSAIHSGGAVCNETWAGASAAFPGFWFSNTQNITLDHVSIFSAYNAGKIGITSTGDRSSGAGASAGLSFRGGEFGVQNNLGDGPTIDVGSNSFWIYMDDGITFSANNLETYSISSLSRSGKVVTLVTSTTNDFAIGDDVTIINALDPSFDSVNYGTYTVTGVSGTPQTTITFAQNGPTSSSSGGQVFGDKSAAININPTGGVGSGDFYIDHAQFITGGLRYTIGTASWGGQISNSFMESGGSNCTPTVTLTNPNGFGNFLASNVQAADCTNTVYAVEVDGPGSVTPETVVADTSSVEGPATLRGQYQPAVQQNQTVSPTAQHQQGFVDGTVFGQHNSARRGFSPIAVRSSNIAATNPASWTSAGGTGSVTTGVAAPDGTTGAGTITWASGTNYQAAFYSANITWTVGDYYIFGAWARSTTGNGYFNGTPIAFNQAGGANCTPTSIQNPKSPYLGDGEWEWVWGICQPGLGTGGSHIVTFFGWADSTHTESVYGPVLMHFAAGAISNDEAYEIANALSTYAPSCTAGQLCDLTGPVPHAFSGTTGTITGTALTASCDTGTVSVAGAAAGSPVQVSTTDGTDLGGAFNLRASVTSTGTVTVYVCGTGTPASKAYNVKVLQ